VVFVEVNVEKRQRPLPMKRRMQMRRKLFRDIAEFLKKLR